MVGHVTLRLSSVFKAGTIFKSPLIAGSGVPKVLVGCSNSVFEIPCFRTPHSVQRGDNIHDAAAVQHAASVGPAVNEPGCTVLPRGVLFIQVSFDPPCVATA